MLMFYLRFTSKHVYSTLKLTIAMVFLRKACAALGRALMGTLLLGALKGDAETVQVRRSVQLARFGFYSVAILRS